MKSLVTKCSITLVFNPFLFVCVETDRLKSQSSLSSKSYFFISKLKYGYSTVKSNIKIKTSEEN